MATHPQPPTSVLLTRERLFISPWRSLIRERRKPTTLLCVCHSINWAKYLLHTLWQRGQHLVTEEQTVWEASHSDESNGIDFSVAPQIEDIALGVHGGGLQGCGVDVEKPSKAGVQVFLWHLPPEQYHHSALRYSWVLPMRWLLSLFLALFMLANLQFSSTLHCDGDADMPLQVC